MKKIVLLIALWLAAITVVSAQHDEEIQWKSWSELEEALRKDPKPVFLFFHADWCVYCKKIEREIFTKKSVIRKMNKEYYALRMDVESRDTVAFDGLTFVNKQALTRRNGIHELPALLASREDKPFSLPATLILDKKFALVERIFEYYTSSELLNML
ncbi:thioredoxin family protein [Zeaxanthinibacter sp. PT1]|uniref:thioredoxin family protein n=1 Tax=Zeaxanthinibacter TaxID=561554 RepID=UPI00234B1FAD|nr:thioredoxin family protein [Zeaxanthinibacter sp. PT1]MDC6352705.1 thioredoxin family protein [Zeaxanthinibacter sp. PT1]